MARKTKEEAEKTRQAIIESAFRVFRTKGYSKTTLHDIAVEAGVTRGAVYWLFKNKPDVFGQLMDHAFRPFEVFFEGILESTTSPIEIFIKFMDAWLSRATTQSHFMAAFEIVFLMTEWSDELMPYKMEYRSMELKFIKDIEEIFDKGIKDGSFRPDLNAHTAAVYYYSNIFGLAQVSLFFEEQLEIGKSKRDYMIMFLNSCAAEEYDISELIA